jgi:hemolysin (HlyC) family protein
MPHDEEDPGAQKSWLERLIHVFHSEPQNREELLACLSDAKSRELINADDLAMIEGVMQFSKMQARDIMIPRAQAVVINESESHQDFLPTVIKSGHSRFPVTNDDGNEIIGILHAKDLLPYSFNQGENFNLKDIIRAPVIVPESKRLNVLLREFRNNHNHMAVVVDEYGSVAGFITIEDIIEVIVGDIEDEFDVDEEAHIKQHSPSKFVINAQTSIDEFNEFFQTRLNDEGFDTIGGLITHAFGHLPKPGEVVTVANFIFKVVHADNRRIRLLEAEVIPEQTQQTA